MTFQKGVEGDRKRETRGLVWGIVTLVLLVFTTKLYKRLVKSIEKGGREQERDREGGRQRVR